MNIQVLLSRKKGLLLPLVLVFFTTVLAACNNKPVPADKLVAGGVDGSFSTTLEVGKAPIDFSSIDADGNEIVLSEYVGKSGVMLIFYRGNWCPFCVSHLDDIQNLFPLLKEHNIQLLALSPDDAAASEKLAKKFDQPYVFVEDKDLAIAGAYGIKRDEKLPHPAVVLIDKAGEVVWFYVGEDYKQRPSAEQLTQVIEAHF